MGLITERNLGKYHWVRAAKDQGKSSWFHGKSRVEYEWGQITQLVDGPVGRHDGRVKVQWDGGKHDFTNCEIRAYSRTDPRARIRRRLPSRDSPGLCMLHRHR